MKKPYLLIAGHDYYPGARTSDWIGRFETDEEARQHLRKIEYDWYEIVNLETWER